MGKKEIAKNLLKKGNMTAKEISEITGLSIKDIKALNNIK